VLRTHSCDKNATLPAMINAPSSRFLHMLLALNCLISIVLAPNAFAQTRGGRGAMSAQDMQKMAAGPLASSATGGACPDLAEGSTVTPPTDLFSQNGVLEVTLNLQTDVDASGRQRYCYVTNTGLISPTLRVNPGDTLLIHFYNQIPSGLVPVVPEVMPNMPNMASMTSATSSTTAKTRSAGMQVTLHDTQSSSDSACSGGVMSASASNLHFHGLNVTPLCHSDEVVNTLVQPGQEFDYSVQIPANEPSGLYWYHPHPHGFSEGQVQGGATGAIIVEGIQQADPALVGLPEQTLVLRDLLTPVSEQNDTNVPAWDISLDNVPVPFPSYTPAILPVAPGQQQLWRILNSAADTIFNLQYVVAGTAQTFTVVAIDGVPITGGPIQQNSVLLPPGSRAEIVVTTPAIGQSAQLITNYVNTGPDGDYDPTRPIANVVASTSAPALPILQAGASSSAAISKAKVVRRFSALSQAAPVAQRTLYFSEQLQDPTDPNSPTTFFITQVGATPEAYTMGQAPNIIVHSGTVEDWTIQNTALEDHIFHIHQIHFQVLAVNGVPVNDPAIRDTYDLPYWTGQGPYPSITVRMDFRDPNIVGTFVYHCHILQHEDSGMMGAIEVLPAGAASTTTATVSNVSLNPNANVTLTANVVDAATGSFTPTGTVQFQINGANIGSPVALVSGQAVLTTPVTGAAGSGNITAFYQGDATYTESVSSPLPITMSTFALTSTGTTAPVGSAALANVNVNVSDGYTTLINLTCTMPASLTESACFIDPGSMSGTGQVTLRVNTTPAHPVAIQQKARPGWLAAGSSFSLAGLLLFVFPRRKGSRNHVFVLLSFGLLFASLGCSSGAAKTDTGTPTGSYVVVVTGTSSTGSSQIQSTVNVPITIQ
jgi:FtsP/CotA-like multicopper oxidase with cupredoxin domain